MSSVSSRELLDMAPLVLAPTIYQESQGPAIYIPSKNILCTLGNYFNTSTLSAPLTQSHVVTVSKVTSVVKSNDILKLITEYHELKDKLQGMRAEITAHATKSGMLEGTYECDLSLPFRELRYLKKESSHTYFDPKSKVVLKITNTSSTVLTVIEKSDRSSSSKEKDEQEVSVSSEFMNRIISVAQLQDQQKELAIKINTLATSLGYISNK